MCPYGRIWIDVDIRTSISSPPCAISKSTSVKHKIGHAEKCLGIEKTFKRPTHSTAVRFCQKSSEPQTPQHFTYEIYIFKYHPTRKLVLQFCRSENTFTAFNPMANNHMIAPSYHVSTSFPK